MTVLSFPLVLIILAASCVLHVVACIVPGIYAKITSFVNIGLHIALFWALMLADVSYEEAAVVYMASVFVYTLCAYTRHRISGRGDS